MCSYCGCESEAVVAELMAEHETVGLMARRASTALATGDRRTTLDTCAEIAALFDAHGGKEEAGLFAELRAEGLAVDVVRGLEADHRRIEVGLALLAAGDTSHLGQVLAELLDHAEREDSDLFPAALQLLPNDAWSRISTLHQDRSACGRCAGRTRTRSASVRSAPGCLRPRGPGAAG
jgi:hypothetical protein